MKKLDFIVLGAAKAGTTTLFELVKEHPQLSMPKEKEVPFFDEKKIYVKGLDWYLETYFSKVPKDNKWGTVTPQYMLGKGNMNPEVIAGNIKKDLPNIKLVAIIRHPVERAYSHYQMLTQRGHFTENFDKAVDNLLKNKSVDNLRHKNIDDTNSFLFGGEYGRILEYFYNEFPKKNILVLFTDDLKNNPEGTIQKFFNFIEVDDNFVPKNLGKEYRKGGSKARVKLLTPGMIYKIPFIKKVWKDYTPYSFRKRVEYTINLWNTKSGETKFGPYDPAFKKLVKFYSADIDKLEKLIGHKVPWEEWR